MKLFARTNGEGPDALVIIPGLLGSSANWQSIAKRLGQHRTVYSLDMRNHGQSPWSEHISYEAMAEDVVAFIATLDHTCISLLGHSMGGKVAMRAALSYPQHIDSLIVADIAPRIYRHDFEELIAPMLRLDLAQIKSRAQADSLLSTSIENASIRAFLLHNLGYDTQSKHYTWRPNLEVLLENMDEIVGFRLAREARYEKPTLFIHGQESDYVRESDKPAILDHFPRAIFAGLENAGHWLHAEQPAAFIRRCEYFLTHDS